MCWLQGLSVDTLIKGRRGDGHDEYPSNLDTSEEARPSHRVLRWRPGEGCNCPHLSHGHPQARSCISSQHACPAPQPTHTQPHGEGEGWHPKGRWALSPEPGLGSQAYRYILPGKQDAPSRHQKCQGLVRGLTLSCPLGLWFLRKMSESLSGNCSLRNSSSCDTYHLLLFFFWLRRVLVAERRIFVTACGIFSCSMQSLSCGM